LPSIGKPVMNTDIYIVDKWGKLLQPGAAGEIWIGGVQVGRGYLNRPELTAEKFVISHSSLVNGAPNDQFPMTNDHLYKTGDIARWHPDGNLEFLGRLDVQVKIRGFRVEPGEIESRLSNYPGIKDVVVVAREEKGGDKYICAYIVSSSAYEISGVREFLSKELPDYMIPSYFVRLEKIPLTPSGKVDRKALPPPERATEESYMILLI
jgi:acyl-CoA synthetase (AMP-forming)/AMP-acid ligase II